VSILSRRGFSKVVPKLEPRLAVLAVLMVLALCASAFRLYYLQVVETQELSNLSDKNRIRLLRVPAPRGLVFDDRHRVLIDTRPSFDAVIVPEDTHDLDRTVTSLERYLGEDHIGQKISEAQDDGRPEYDPITVEERLSWEQVVAIESHQLDLPGVSLQVTPRRRYIYGPLAAHLLGYVGEVSLQELRKEPGYHMGDEIGKYGLERGLEGFLRGNAGGQKIEVDAVGRRLRTLDETPESPGRTVTLTLDLDVQQVAENSMGTQNGALVALDVNTGGIIAMLSRPNFDPNVFAAGIDSARWQMLATDPDHPLQNRSIQGTYPPGSTFKVLDSIAGLQEHSISLETNFHCGGGMWFGNREYRCWRKQGHGTLSLHRAIVESCDVYFYNVGNKVGVDKLAYWAHEFGLGMKTGIDLDNERAGIVPSTAWKRKKYGERWYPAETLSVAIGQGYVNVTPLELAEFAAEIANGGIRYKPHFVKQIESLDGRIVKAEEPEVEHRVALDPEVVQIVHDAMGDVVNGPHGTAHKAKLDGITVCGKTGTAQVIKEAQGVHIDEDKLPLKYRDHAIFIAFAPKDNPKIAVACIIEHGGHGGAAAAPIVHDVMAKYFELNPPDAAPPPADKIPPDTTTYNGAARALRTALR
jgi:penicillin-binding protein 2